MVWVDQQSAPVVDLVFAVLVWAVASVSYKIFEAAGITIATYLIITRFFKLGAVWTAHRAAGVRHEPIRSTRELSLIFLNALFSIGTPLFFFLSLSYTSLSNAYFLAYTMPAWVLIFAVLFLGEKLTLKKALGLILTIAGIGLIAMPQNMVSFDMGMVLALLSAFSFSGDVITARALKDYSYQTVTFHTNLFQFLFVLPAFLLIEVHAIPNALLLIIALSLIGIALGIASYAYYFALEKLEASKAAIITLLELGFASVLAYLILGEVPQQNEFAGYAVIMAATIILILRKVEVPHFSRLLHLKMKH